MTSNSDSLPERIRAAELRVLARDAALRQRIERARRGWLPLAAGGAFAVAGALGLLLLRPRRAAPASAGLSFVGLLWSLLPLLLDALPRRKPSSRR